MRIDSAGQDGPVGTQPQDVVLVTVTYGQRWHLLEQVLDAAFDQGVGQAIVIDNGAADPVAARAQARYGAMVRVIDMGRNTGSAPGFRAGIAAAVSGSARFILLLDDDNRLEPGALAQLLAAQQQAAAEAGGDDTAAALQVMVAFRPANQSEVAAGAHRRMLQRHAFLGFDLRQLPARLWRRWSRVQAQSAVARPVPPLALLDVAPYGGMLFDKALVAAIGLPNPDFVLYADDTEFSWRVTRRGGRLLLVTAARIHDVDTSWNLQRGPSSGLVHWLRGGSDLSTYYALRNRVYFETHHVHHSALWRGINRLVFVTVLRLVSRRLGTEQRLALLLQALADGEAKRLGVKPGLLLK